jgi:hypothetical protein
VVVIMRIWWIVVPLVLAGFLLAACGGGGEESSGATPPGATEGGQAGVITDGAGMALDAIPGGALDASRTVTGGDPFEVDLVIDKAVSGYQAYQFRVQWDGSVLAYDSEKDLMPAELTLCAPGAMREDSFYSGCARTADNTNFTGPVNTLTFHCIADGTSQLHLISIDEDADFNTTALGYGGVVIETELADASVTCQGAR